MNVVLKTGIVLALVWVGEAPVAANDFDRCIERGVPREKCEHAVLSTSPDTDAGHEATESFIDRHAIPSRQGPQAND